MIMVKISENSDK